MSGAAEVSATAAFSASMSTGEDGEVACEDSTVDERSLSRSIEISKEGKLALERKANSGFS